MLSSIAAALVSAIRASAGLLPFVSSPTARAARLYVTHSCRCAAAVSAAVNLGAAFVVEGYITCDRFVTITNATTATIIAATAITNMHKASAGQDRESFGGGGGPQPDQLAALPPLAFIRR